MTDTNIGDLVDSTKFSEFYFNRLKEKLNLTDINLNRLGFIGFFIELLGNVQFDVKGYYDYLFNESFPISASNNINLLYHSSVFGYSPELAKPAEIFGSFNIEPLLSNSTNVQKRELFLEDISFIIDNVEFRLDSNYKIIYTRNTNSDYYIMNVEILYKNIYDTVPLLYSNAKIKTIGLLQYSQEDIQFGLSNYPFGSHYIYDLNITDYLYELSIEIEVEPNNFRAFKPLPIKEFASDTDEVVFYSILPGNILRLQFGSGIKGAYVPGRTVKVLIKTTKAEQGNIGQHIISLVKGNIVKIDYDINDVIITNPKYPLDDGKESIPASTILTLDIINGIGGKNPDTDNLLRQKLLQYIQTRENLVSDVDFHNNLKPYSKDSEILFKKTEIAENVIYLYGRILNKYLYPVYTTTETILKSEFEQELKIKNNKKYIVNPSFTIYNDLFNCPFYFEYNELFNTYDGYIYYETIDYFPSEFPIIDNDLIISSSNIPKDLFVTLLHDKIEDITTICIKTNSLAFDNMNEIVLNSQLLGIANITLTKENNFRDGYFYYEYSGIISVSATLYLTVTIDYVNLKFIFYDVQNVFTYKQSLRLKFYTKNNIRYVMNVPLIHSEEYATDRLYYINIIKSMFDNINLKENRMVSDEVQFRFLNTHSIKNTVNVTLLKQQYDMDIALPFKLIIDLTFSKDEVLLQKLKIPNIINDIRLEVSQYIIEHTTGLNLNFYKSKISDICHNYPAIKLVIPLLTDNTGIEIPNGAIESLEKDLFIDKIDKLTYLKYTPTFWWFDINNIIINSHLL